MKQGQALLFAPSHCESLRLSVRLHAEYALRTSAIGAILFFIIVGRLQAFQYSVDGSLSFCSCSPIGQVVLEIRREFGVTVDGCQWLIKTTNRNPQGVVLARWETGCTNDGQIFRATYYPTNPKSHIMAVVESNAIPSACDDNVSQYLLLMLASGCYLDDIKDNLLPPVYEPLLSVLYDKNLRYPAFVNRFEKSPHLPSRIVYMNDGFYRTRDSNNKTTIRFKDGWPFENGFTNAVFSVSGVTNAGQILIPSRFGFVEYHKHPVIT